MSSLPKTLGLGPLAYHLYHRPIAALGDSIRAGGPVGQWRTERGRRQMEVAALGLPSLPLPAPGETALEIHVLTGRKFWYQTAFCLWTFGKQTGRPLAPVIHDDGSLTEEWRSHLRRIVPGAFFVSKEEAIARLDEFLPQARFPLLRERWQNYPHLRKLTDVHAGRVGWRLSMDSDLLFFSDPVMLVDWLDRPTRPLHATDVQNAYGYPLELLAELAGRPVPELVNTGLCGLSGEDIDWPRLEDCCRRLFAQAGKSYYLEQALAAILLAGRDCVVAPISSYVTLPVAPEVHECRAVMHHYVAGSKRWYFRNNWRRALSAGEPRSGEPPNPKAL